MLCQTTKRSTGHIQDGAGRVLQEKIKDAQPGHTKPHTTRYEKHWKNSKLFRIPTKNKNNSEKFSGQQLRRYTVEGLLPDFPLGQRRVNKMRKVKGDPPSRD
jgi:hypothetical protein